MRNQILLFSLLLIMTSCTSYLVQYQVYTVKSDLKQGNGSLKYENEDCILHYNLWAEGGNPGFVMENKTDSDIFVLMDRSFYIHNGIAYNYYNNREITKGYASTYHESINIDGKVIYPYYSIFSPIDATKKVGYSTNHVSSITVKEEPVICIPPHSAKYIPVYYRISDETLYQDGETKIENSPYIFRNRISYSLNDDDYIKHIENKFWVSDIEDIKPNPQKTVNSVKENKDKNNRASVNKILSESPNKFYIEYYE